MVLDSRSHFRAASRAADTRRHRALHDGPTTRLRSRREARVLEPRLPRAGPGPGDRDRGQVRAVGEEKRVGADESRRHVAWQGAPGTPAKGRGQTVRLGEADVAVPLATASRTARADDGWRGEYRGF